MEVKHLLPTTPSVDAAGRGARVGGRPLAAVAVLVVMMAVGTGAGAQPSTTAADAGLDERIQILGVEETPDEVILEVAVPPAIGRLAPVEANFGVTDGGQLVGIEVAPVGTAADTVMVIDTSGSMRGSALAAAKAAAAGFVGALPDDVRVGLISFGDTVVTHRTPTLDRAGLLADLDGLTAGGEQTVLWDALM
ncbi:MAG: VWA domain-containing protein, partial [Acidimicrobiales bacterium]